MQYQLQDLTRRFASDRGGNVAMIFALVLVPIIGVVSLSIDYGRALKTKSLIYNAADAALHGNLAAILLDRDELQRRVRISFDANLPEDLRGLPINLLVNEQARTIQLSTATVVPTAIMALIGVDRMDVAVTSTVRWPEPKNSPSINPGPMLAGRPTPADAARAADDLVRQLSKHAPGAGGATTASVPALSADDIKSARDALVQNPEIQRMQAELEARMREAMSKMRR